MSHNSNVASESPTREEYEQKFGHPEPPQHRTVHVSTLDANIDRGVLDLVFQFNSHCGIQTVSSCQGDPGVIGEGGRYGHVCFTITPLQDYEVLSRFLFGFLYNLTKDLWDDVRVEMTTSDSGFLGWVYFRNESIKELTNRLQV